MTCRAALDAVPSPDSNDPGEDPGTGRANPVIFCGDLNDEPLRCDDADHSGPGRLGDRLRPGSGFRTGDDGDGYRMGTSTGSCRGPNHTRIYRGRGELIDHMFASHRLVNPDNIPAVDIVVASPLPSMTDDPTPQTPAPTGPRRGRGHLPPCRTAGSRHHRGVPSDRSSGRPGLTEREVDVLRLLAPRSNKEMAVRLGIAPKTVSHHVAHIHAGVGVTTRAGATLFAMEPGLLSARPPAEMGRTHDAHPGQVVDSEQNRRRGGGHADHRLR